MDSYYKLHKFTAVCHGKYPFVAVLYLWPKHKLYLTTYNLYHCFLNEKVMKMSFYKLVQLRSRIWPIRDINYQRRDVSLKMYVYIH